MATYRPKAHACGDRAFVSAVSSSATPTSVYQPGEKSEYLPLKTSRAVSRSLSSDDSAYEAYESLSVLLTLFVVSLLWLRK